MAYAGDIISTSFNMTKELFFPIRKDYWIKMGLVSMMGGSDGGNSFSNGYNGSSQDNDFGKEMSLRDAVIKFNSEALNFLSNYGYIVYTLIAILYLTSLLFSYVNSIMGFVFIDGIVNKEIKIRKSFEENKPVGSSLFVLRFYLGLIGLAGTLACLYPLIQAFYENRLADFNLWFLIPMITGFIILAIALGIIGFVVNDFLVPIMHTKKCTYGAAFEEFKKISKNKKGEIILYWLLKIALGIATGILLLILFIPILIVLILAVFLGGVFYYLINSSAGQIYAILIIGAISVIALLFFIFVSCVLYVPVFFRIYSIEMMKKLEENSGIAQDKKPKTNTLAKT